MDTLHHSFACVPTAPLQMAHKQVARAPNHRRRATPLSLSIQYPTPRHLPVAMFRSPRVLEEVVEVEKQHKDKVCMTPEEAFEKLQHILRSFPKKKDAHEILTGLQRACWQPFAVDGESGNEMQQPQVLYSQLFRGTQEILIEEQTACQNLRDQIQQLKERNNQLPHRIQESQTALTRALELTRHGIGSEWKRIGGDRVDKSAILVCQAQKETQQRKELRTWACNNVRANLTDLTLRHHELKRQVYDTSCSLKKEEQANQMRVKRLNDLRTSLPTFSPSPTCRVDSKPCPQPPLARFTLALAKNQMLQDKLQERRAFVRARTEAIFDVRSLLHDLNDQRLIVAKALTELEEQAAQVKRACTPRPDWRELRDATCGTTAVDQVDLVVRVRTEATHAAEGDCDPRVMQILSSNWSTVDKVGALASELATIRSRDHAVDTIASETTTLKLLHLEIARLMQQLDAVTRQTATDTRE